MANQPIMPATSYKAYKRLYKNRGRKPIHAIPDSLKEHVAMLYQDSYHGCNHCHCAELLQERASLTLSVSTVRRILLEEGLN